MAVYVNKNKWSSVKIGGKSVRKIFKNGEKIYDAAAPLTNPIQGAALVDISGNTNYDFTAPHSGWYRLVVASAAGTTAANRYAPGQGALISHDIYLLTGARLICWAPAGAVSGAPAVLKGGDGAINAGYNAHGKDGKLGGGGASGGTDSGYGGAGAAGDGLNGDNWNNGSSGAGAGIIIYQGEDFYQWGEDFYTKKRNPQIGDTLYDSDGNVIDWEITAYDSTEDTITACPANESECQTISYKQTIFAYSKEENWLLLLLCGGGGGNCGDNGDYRTGGGGGGAGGDGGFTNWASGGTGGYSSLAGIEQGGSSGRYGAGGNGAGNVIDVSDPDNKFVVKNRTYTNDSRTGYVRIYPLS